jgi:hypothetical protein
VLWSKWGYKPWDHPPVAQAPTSEGRELLHRLAELAACNRGDRNVATRRCSSARVSTRHPD